MTAQPTAPGVAAMPGADEIARACPACGCAGGPTLLAGRDRLVPGVGRFEVIRCPGCRLAFTHPRAIDFAAHYPATSYHAYLQARDSRFHRLRLWLITRSSYGPIARRPPGRLLDVGCGSGDLALAFRRQGWAVSGIEPSREAAAIAHGHGIDVHCGTLDDAPWPDGTFDAVVMNHSLEHVGDPLAALRATRRLLAPGGALGVAVPNFRGWQRRVFGSAWFQLDLPRHLQHFEARTLSELARQAGFAPVRTRSNSMMAGLPSSIQYAVLGRRVLTGRGGRLLALALYPLLALSDVVLEGDCLNLVAVKPAERDQLT